MPALRSLILALSLTLSLAPMAYADPPPKRDISQGREHAARGIEHVKARRWSEARDAFRAAFAVQETAVIAYYLGICEENLGNFVEAERHIQRAVDIATSGQSGESAATRKAVLEDARELSARVDAKVVKAVIRWQAPRPEGVKVTFDGEVVEVDDLPNNTLRVNPGKHTLKATAPGKKPYEVTTDFDHPELSFQLYLDPEAPAPAPVVVREAPPAPPPPPSGGGWQRPVGYVGLGLGAALLGAGVFSSLKVSSQQDKLESDPGYVAYRQGVQRGSEACGAAGRGDVVMPSPSGATPVSPSTFSGTCDSRDRYQALQYVFYGTGAAFALAGAYFAFLAPSGEHKPPPSSKGLSWHVTPAVGPSAARVTWEVSF